MGFTLSHIKAYGRSKFANILFSNELARRLKGTTVTSNAAHPGIVRTSFGNEATVTRIFYGVAAPLIKTPEKGAQTSIYLAASPEVEGKTGGYWANCKPGKPHSTTQDADVARRLWEQSAKLVGI